MVKLLWRKPLPSKGLGGIAATGKYVIVSGREPGDTQDFWRILDAVTGETHWTLRYEAPGNLDYGNSPRATPLIAGDTAFLYGAFGHLHAVDMPNKRILWKLDTKTAWGEPPGELPWGCCGSPLFVADKLVLYHGSERFGLVALDPKTGAVIWSTPAGPPGYGSLIAARLGGIDQIVGHDAKSLNGWDASTGKNLWSLAPPRPKDFNVPAPMTWNGHLIVSTENNGTRMYRFQPGGAIDPTPVAAFADLAPETHSPVIVGDRLFGINNRLYCLDLTNGLKPIWSTDDDAFAGHASIIASENRVMIATDHAELLLVDAAANSFKLLDRRTLLDDEQDMYAHPAVAGNRLYLRSADAVHCFDCR